MLPDRTCLTKNLNRYRYAASIAPTAFNPPHTNLYSPFVCVTRVTGICHNTLTIAQIAAAANIASRNSGRAAGDRL